MNDRAKRLYEIRVNLRQALESFEIVKIEQLGKSLIDTLTEVDNGGFIGAPILLFDRVTAVANNREIRELCSEILSDRLQEVKNVTLFLEGGVGIQYEDSMLAAVLDVPVSTLSSYTKFALSDSREAFMWGKALKKEPESPGQLLPPGLSYNSRLALCVMKAITRFVPTTVQKISRKISVGEAESERLLKELQEFRLARRSTAADLLSLLTVAQIDPLVPGLAVAKNATKVKKIDAIVLARPRTEIIKYIESVDPTCLENVWTVGLNIQKGSEFHRQWSELVGHFLVFSVSRDGEWVRRKELPGYLMADWKIVVCGGAPNTCSHCRTKDKKEVKTIEDAPPFHLGCRCVTVNVPSGI